jgi:alpha-L-fucosidase 2
MMGETFMSAKGTRMGKFILFRSVCCSLLALLLHAQDSAWRDGSFYIDAPGVVGRSDIYLGQPNRKPSEAMPLGNGRLGVAVWSADGLTAQLNRADTLPGRYSPGQVSLPGLATLTAAKNYIGRLHLYDGTFQESGAGMSASVYVQPDRDVLVIDVTGAPAAAPQTAQLKLWEPRTPLAAITAEGRSVSVKVTDPLTITVTVTPEADGHFRILVAAPHDDGTEAASQLLEQGFREVAPQQHQQWWSAFWQRAGLIKISSADGSGEYLENLRHLYLFAAAASSGGEYPGSQAGVADLFSAVQDTHLWDPAAFWHWNLRMQVAANLGAGLPELNAPYFRLYRANLGNIEKWTREHMGQRPGICVPETMRFNGQGIEYEAGPLRKPPITALNCDASSPPYYNARTISTGAEVSLWIWQQFLMTNDRQFLQENYPLMAEAARFLLSYQTEGSDGLEHTHPSNAHETQWDTTDPTTDLSARMALFPAMLEAAKLLGRDEDLLKNLQAAIPRIPPLPRTQPKPPLRLLPPGMAQDDVIAESYEPNAAHRNVQNIGLEPVWPYHLISDASPLFALARRTYQHRPFPVNQDWSFDPIQAARLRLGSEVKSTLIQLTTRYQQFVNGFASWGGSAGEFYIEQQAVTAAALQEALVQDYDGVIRIAPAVPPGWDMDGTVALRNQGKAYVQVRNGIPVTVAIKAGARPELTVANPWPGESVNVINGATGARVKNAADDPIVRFQAEPAVTYLVEKASAAKATKHFTAVSGTPAHSSKKMGTAQIGLPAVQ